MLPIAHYFVDLWAFIHQTSGSKEKKKHTYM